MQAIWWIASVLLLNFYVVKVNGVDRTLVERATGSSVVEAVIDKIRGSCIFENDRLFVRRMAFVESKDGYDHNTFRANFFGGIWQITEQQYLAGRNCSGVLAEPCKKILQVFKIDWSRTQWSDLMKPLYSGLATYMFLKLRGKTIAGDVTTQDSIWRHYFHPGVTINTNKFQQAANKVSVGCEKPTDLAFLLDESGSVGQANYDKVKQFLEKSINRLPISPDQFRVSVTTFSSSANVLFYLNTYSTKSQMIQSIKSMGYNGGGTDTSTGINTVVNNVFNPIHGAKLKKDAPRVLVLVTDGQSNNRAQTVAAANIARQNGIEIFSVGVGSNLDKDELQQVAGTCSRVFSLLTFDDMDNFLHELIKNACGAKSTIEIPDTPSNSTNSTDVTVIDTHVPENGTRIGVVVTPKGNGTTIVVETNCSTVRIFGSYNDTNPSESVFEITGTAADGRPMVLFVKADENGRPLYLTFEASKVNTTQTFCFNDSTFHVKFNKGKPKVGDIFCVENGVTRNCTIVDIIQSKWSNKLCPPTDVILRDNNPCTPDKLRSKELIFPYPHDDTKYLKCDLKGRVYVIICPLGLRYHPIRQNCGDHHVTHPKRIMSPEHSNLCTYDNIRQDIWFFPYPANKLFFIECDVWGRAWVIPCPPKTTWITSASACVSNVRTTVSSLLNPCKPNDVAKGIVFYPYPHNPHRYIHCDDNANPWVQFCPPNKVFDLKFKICVSSGSH